MSTWQGLESQNDSIFSSWKTVDIWITYVMQNLLFWQIFCYIKKATAKFFTVLILTIKFHSKTPKIRPKSPKTQSENSKTRFESQKTRFFGILVECCLQEYRPKKKPAYVLPICMLKHGNLYFAACVYSRRWFRKNKILISCTFPYFVLWYVKSLKPGKSRAFSTSI